MLDNSQDEIGMCIENCVRSDLNTADINFPYGLIPPALAWRIVQRLILELRCAISAA